MKDPESRSKIDNTDLVDELTEYFDEMLSICDLLRVAGEKIDDPRTVANTGYLLMRKTHDAKELLNSWWKDRPTKDPDNVSAIV